MNRIEIALSKLVPSAQNVRRATSTAGIAELAEDIAAHGLIHNLTVTKAAKGAKYEVVAGARRLAAMRLLAKDRRWNKDQLVPCAELAHGELGVEISLAENFAREAMNPADEAAAFATLAGQGTTADQIAARFGISVGTVRKRLKLAVLAVELLDVLRTGEMTSAQAEALALSSDPDRQRAAWFDVSAYYRSPDYIRQALSSDWVRPGEKIAKFIRDEYAATGGPVEIDLFTEAGEAFMTDRALAQQLASAKLDAILQSHLADGWGWGEVRPHMTYGVARLTPELGVDPEIAARLEALQDELEPISEELDAKDITCREDAETEADLALLARYGEIQDAIAQLGEFEPRFSDEQKQRAGIVIALGYGGEVEIAFGVIAENETGNEGGEQAATPSAKAAKPGGLSAALIEDLTIERTAALANALADRPDIALAVLVHSLALSHLYPYRYQTGNAALISAKGPKAPSLSQQDTSIMAGLASRRESWRAQLPEEAGQLWTWCLAQPQPVLSEVMAMLVGLSLDGVQERHESRRDKHRHADRIADAIGFDMNQHWEADAAFFGRTSKAVITQAVREAGGPDADRHVKAIAGLKKAGAATLAATVLAGQNWLPDVLQTRIEAAEPQENAGEPDSEPDAGDIEDEQVDAEPEPDQAEPATNVHYLDAAE
jgi:ParB family chromosome partitioning protein